MREELQRDLRDVWKTYEWKYSHTEIFLNRELFCMVREVSATPLNTTLCSMSLPMTQGILLLLGAVCKH